MREEETDLSFAEFGGSERLYPAPTESGELGDTRKFAESMARREGLEPPTLRFEERTSPNPKRKEVEKLAA